jgi:heme-degrading monooxygenase HmoA
VPILGMFEVPGATVEQYDRTMEALQMQTDEQMPGGAISHVAGSTGDGILVVDIWESEEALGRFVDERLASALREGGIDPGSMNVRVLPVHNLVEQGAGTRAGVILVVDIPGWGLQQYDAMVARADAHRDGGRNHPAVSHAAAVTDGGMLVVDVWESPAAFERFFAEQIAPGAAAADLPAIEPRVIPAHNRLRGRARQAMA